jgi:phage shock protein C
MPRRLERSETDYWIAGVCGGLAEYLQLDPLLVRAVMFILAFPFGVGILIYIFLLIFMPSPTHAAAVGPASADPGAPAPPPAYVGVQRAPLSPEEHERRRYSVGFFLVLIGLVFLAGESGLFRFMEWRYIWPLLLIAIGAFLIVGRVRR